MLRHIVLSAGLLAASAASAQDFLSDLAGRTYREKSVYAVYDFRGPNVDAAAIEGLVLDAVRLYETYFDTATAPG